MLDGQLVHLPALETHCTKDIVFDKDTPIFSTGKHAIIYIKNGVIDERETEMMSVRWRVFNFNCQIPTEERRDILPCPNRICIPSFPGISFINISFDSLIFHMLAIMLSITALSIEYSLFCVLMKCLMSYLLLKHFCI